jgi:hypothetical protein
LGDRFAVRSQGAPRDDGTINWGIFKRHFRGELLRHQQLSSFPQELLFPAEFVGRGDMSRGGLMLRSVDAHMELAYVPVRGAILRGARPPKLPPR